jgi:hypothetical protein
MMSDSDREDMKDAFGRYLNGKHAIMWGIQGSTAEGANHRGRLIDWFIDELEGFAAFLEAEEAEPPKV